MKTSYAIIAWFAIVVIEIITAYIFISIPLHSGPNYTIYDLISIRLFTLIPILIPIIVTLTPILYQEDVERVIEGSIIVYTVSTTMLLYAFKIWNDLVYVIGLFVVIIGMYFSYIPLVMAGIVPLLFSLAIYNTLLIPIISLTPLAIWIITWKYRRKNVDIISLVVASAILLFYYSLDESLVNFVRSGGAYIAILLWSLVNKKFPNIFNFKENLKYGILEIKENVYVWIITTYIMLNTVTAIKEGMVFRAVYEVLVGIIFYSIYSGSKNTKFLNDVTVI